MPLDLLERNAQGLGLTQKVQRFDRILVVEPVAVQKPRSPATELDAEAREVLD